LLKRQDFVPRRFTSGKTEGTAEITDQVRKKTTVPSTRRRNRRGDTPPPLTGGGETETLRGFLDYLRASIAAKVDGAPEPQVRTAAVPSGTNLLAPIAPDRVPAAVARPGPHAPDAPRDIPLRGTGIGCRVRLGPSTGLG
jgi:hypothetical protein